MPPPNVPDFGGLDRLKAAIEGVAKDFNLRCDRIRTFSWFVEHYPDMP